MKSRGLMSRRLWIKLYVDECLDGSIRHELTPGERCVWYELLLLGGKSRVPGVIQGAMGKAPTSEYFAGRLSIPVKVVASARAKCLEEGRLFEDGDGLHITHWGEYQGQQLALPGFEGKPEAVAGVMELGPELSAGELPGKPVDLAPKDDFEERRIANAATVRASFNESRRLKRASKPLTKRQLQERGI